MEPEELTNYLFPVDKNMSNTPKAFAFKPTTSNIFPTIHSPNFSLKKSPIN